MWATRWKRDNLLPVSTLPNWITGWSWRGPKFPRLKPRPVQQRRIWRWHRPSCRNLRPCAIPANSSPAPLAGAVVAKRLAPGQSVVAGSEVALIMENTGAALEVVSVVTPAQVDHLGVGTEARVLIDDPGGRRTQSVNASVKSITERPAMPPDWLLDYGISAPSRGHWVRLKLDDAPGAPLSDGDPCELHVVLGRHAPVAFLAPRGLN